MSYIRLDKLFSQGYIKNLKINTGETYKPKHDRCAILLGGMINHVTGTLSQITIYDKANFYSLLNEIAAAKASDLYPLFSTLSDDFGSQYPPFLIITEDETIAFTGGTGSYVTLKLLEWCKE